jgi:hypothetical protein
MATLEEDLKLGDLTGDMHEHTDRLAMAMPFTLILFALAAFAAAILWIVYASMAGFNLDEYTNALETLHGNNLTDPQKDWYRNSYREQLGYEGAVIGFLIIISYAVVYGALKIAHRN